MANYKPISLIETITGKLSKRDDTVFRRKIYRDNFGRIVVSGKREAYKIENPRDWRKNPAKGAELQKIEQWRLSSRQTHLITRPEEQILADNDLSNEQKQQLIAQRRELKARFDEQRRKGEPDAPIDPKTGKHKCYQRFDMFVRAILLRQMKKQ